MKRVFLGAIVLVLAMGGVIYSSGVWKQMPPVLATWMGSPSVPDPSSVTAPAGVPSVTTGATTRQGEAPSLPLAEAPVIVESWWEVCWRGLRERLAAWRSPAPNTAAVPQAPSSSTGSAPDVPVAGTPVLALNGISWRGERSVAIVNHRPLGVGDAVDGYVLRQISQTFVELTGRGERVLLYVNGTRQVLPAPAVAPQ